MTQIDKAITKENTKNVLSFTVIELLVIITIILLLFSLLLPALLSTREKAQGLYCMNNLKQIGIASYSYAEENEGYSMPGKFGDTASDHNYNHWINYMYDQLLPKKSVYQCPTLSDGDNFNPAGGNNSITKASYIKNMIEAGQWNGASISTPNSTSWGLNSPSNYFKLQDMINPSNKIDTVDVAEGGIHFNHSGLLNFQETDYGLINTLPSAGYRRVGYHHNLGFNVLMGDTHTEHMKLSDPDQWVVHRKVIIYWDLRS